MAAGTADDGIRDRNAILEVATSNLDNLVAKALAKLDEILGIPLPAMSHDNFIRIMTSQKDAAVSVVNSGLKADENRFRKRENDVLEKLYQQMQAEKAPLLQGQAQRL